ncbi:MAG TPA: hypothetical protein VIK01_06790 [Polyangiaceae bacterium]
MIADKIVALLEHGSYLETAASAAGINRYTLRRWLHRGARGEEPYASLAARILVAQAAAEIRHVATLSVAGTVDWRASAWLLARRSPERWGSKVQQTIEVSGPATPAQAARLVREHFGDRVLSTDEQPIEDGGQRAGSGHSDE